MIRSPPPHMSSIMPWRKIYLVSEGGYIHKLSQLRRSDMNRIGLGRDYWVIFEAARLWHRKLIPVPALIIYWRLRKRLREGYWSRMGRDPEAGVLCRFIELAALLEDRVDDDQLVREALRIIISHEEGLPLILNQAVEPETGSSGRCLYGLIQLLPKIRDPGLRREALEAIRIQANFLLNSFIEEDGERCGWHYYKGRDSPIGIATSLSLRGLVRLLLAEKEGVRVDVSLEKAREVVGRTLRFLVRARGPYGWNDDLDPSRDEVMADTTFYILQTFLMALEDERLAAEVGAELRRALEEVAANLLHYEKQARKNMYDYAFYVRTLVLLRQAGLAESGDLPRRAAERLFKRIDQHYSEKSDIYFAQLCALIAIEYVRALKMRPEDLEKSVAQDAALRKLFRLPPIPPAPIMGRELDVDEVLYALTFTPSLIRLVDFIVSNKIVHILLGILLGMFAAIGLSDEAVISGFTGYAEIQGSRLLASLLAITALWIAVKVMSGNMVRSIISYALSLLAAQFFIVIYQVGRHTALTPTTHMSLLLLYGIVIDVVGHVADKSGITKLLTQR